MFDIFLQIDSTAAVGASTAKVESVWTLLSKGGVIMIPLGILFALVVYFFIERWLVIKKASWS
jgi:biopolymer transport protein ExbB